MFKRGSLLLSLYCLLTVLGSTATWSETTAPNTLVLRSFQKTLVTSGLRPLQIIVDAKALLDAQAEEGLKRKGFMRTAVRNDGTRIYTLGNPIDSGVGQMIVFMFTGDVQLSTYTPELTQVILVEKTGAAAKNEIKPARWGLDFSK